MARLPIYPTRRKHPAAGREIRKVLAYHCGMQRKAGRGRPPFPDVLTPTEWRITHAIQHGLSNKEIARRRGTSTNAVKFHVSNIMSKLGVTNRRELRQQLRAPAKSALPRSNPPSTGVPLSLGRLGQIARSVTDIVASENWYRDVLGLRHLYTFGTLAFFDLAGTRLMLSQSEGGNDSASILYLQTDDIVSAHLAMQARGAEFLNAPHMIHRHQDGTEEWMCFFKDPDGRPLGLMAQVPPVSAP